MSAVDITAFLPPSLNLPPHLSAHKYFFVCTLTVAAWDTLVLSPRTWRLFRTKEWPILKVLFHFLRLFMPIEFTIVAVAFFDTKFTESQCQKFYLFEPICTAILLALCSLVHVIRVSAIYPNPRTFQIGLGALLLAQAVVTGVASGFYRPIPLIFSTPTVPSGQGCIAGPKFDARNWVGIYWVLPTVFYATTFGLALTRSLQSLNVKKISYWKLMLRDGLNLYGAICIVNLVNLIFWFVAKPTDEKDSIKTIVTSMAAVLTTTMTLRIILSIRGPLANGGSFNGGSSSHSASNTHSLSRGGTTGPQIITNRSAVGTNGGVIAINPAGSRIGATEDKGEWNDDRGSANSVPYKEGAMGAGGYGLNGVKVTIDRHTDDGGYAR